MCWVPCDALVLMYGTMHRVGCYRQLQQKFECHMCLDTLVTNVCSRKLQQATVHAKTAQAPTQHQFVFKNMPKALSAVQTLPCMPAHYHAAKRKVHDLHKKD